MELHDFALSLRIRHRRLQFHTREGFHISSHSGKQHKSTDKAFLKFSRSRKIKNEKFREGNKKYSQLVIFRALRVVEFGAFLHDSDWNRWWLLGSQKSFTFAKFFLENPKDFYFGACSDLLHLLLEFSKTIKTSNHVIGSLKHQVIMHWIISELEYLESVPVHTFKVIKFYGTINLTLS